MSKQIYDEAIADIRKIREVAEHDAKLAIVEAVVPHIRELIDRELLSESGDSSCSDDDGADDGEVLNDVREDVACDEALNDLPAADATVDVAEASEDPIRADLDVRSDADAACETADRLTRASTALRSTETFSESVSSLIARVENIYERVQSASTVDRSIVERRLENVYRTLSELQESIEMAKSGKLNEEDVTVKLTGLPDDVDLENIGVDLIAGDEDVDASAEEPAGDEGEDEDFDLSSLGSDEGDEAEGSEEEPAEESVEAKDLAHRRKMGALPESMDDMDDDTVVEIDEGMLTQEIKRLRKLRENSERCDDFGGGSSEGDPWLDADVDEGEGEGHVTVAEAHGEHHDDEVDIDLSDLDDEDGVDVDISGLDGDHEHAGFDPHRDFDDVVDFEGKFELDPKQFEAIERKLALETRLLARARARAKSIREAIQKCRKSGAVKQERSLRSALAEQVSRIDEHSKRVSRINGLKGTVAAKPVNEARTNRASKPAAENAGDRKLREQLAESNLQNAKLRYANKLLQNEGLSARQKMRAIERLDEAKTEREATLVYKGIVNTLSSKPISETTERRVIGSGSRPTGSASPKERLDESVQGNVIGTVERWAQLACLK